MQKGKWMESHEIVRRSVKFENPPRLVYNFPPIGVSDFVRVGYTISDGLRNNSEGHEIDEWGCLWKKWGDGLIGEPVGFPLADWSALKDYEWPDPDDPAKYARMGEQIRNAGDKFVFAGIDGILRRARFLRGFTNLMEDFHLEPQKVHELLERLLDYSLRVLRNYAKFKGIHGIATPEDWGLQTQPFLRVPMFREFFKPIYTKLYEETHSHGWLFRMHSDGYINDLIEEFIEYGLDIVELEQPRALGIEEIGRRYRGRICLEASVDVQATLPRKDRDLIREEVKALMENWSTPDGGIIAVCYHKEDIGVDEETVRMAYEAFQEFDRYRMA